MNYKKRQFIADPIWGQIELFPWETKILNHFVFNRLHDVMQNSCAYLVYPGLKYSRFLHSIGVLHTATEIFTNCIMNTETKSSVLKQKECFSEKEKEWEKCHNKIKEENEYIEKEFKNNWEDERDLIANRTKCSKNFCLLLAVVRIAGLLHDIGHLPYSHVFEFSLINLFKNEKKNNQVKEVENLFGNKSKKIHELLRGHFIDILIEDNQKNIFLAQLLKCAKILWETEDLPISQSILSENIDADRADFVRRDGEFSSLYKSSVDFDRFFCNYELAECDAPIENLKGDLKTEKIILTRPSRRASAEIEKLVQERFLDYKYIVTHHKVHLFDHILEKLLLICFEKGLFEDFLEVFVGVKKRNDNIQGKEKSLKQLKTIKDYFNDSYVNTVLQKLYKISQTDGRKFKEDEKQEIEDLYTTFTEDRTQFVSLFKADEQYDFQIFKKLEEKLKKEQCKEQLKNGSTKKMKKLRLRRIVDQEIFHKKWEKELKSRIEKKKLSANILISGVAKKLKIGVDKNKRKFYNLENCYTYLYNKISNTRPFNVWYFSKNGDKEQEIKDIIIEFLQEKIEELMRETN